MAYLPLPLLTALREAVAARFGQPLRYPSHCDALEAELQKTASAGGRRLSPSTLRRFFGLVEKDGGYHLHTLDTLARYAGHPDFAAFGQAVSGLAAAGSNPATSPNDIPELLAMDRLAYPERLLLGYFLGRITRPLAPDAPATPLALRLAAHPAGQEFFVESFVDLAHINGACGEVISEYLRHKTDNQAQLFGHSTLFLGEFLAEKEPAWRARLVLLQAIPLPLDAHAFPLGRRVFAELMGAWHEAPDAAISPARLAQLRLAATAVPRTAAPHPPLPAFYNLFPAGYHFFVAEALFLSAQYGPLLDWLDFTHAEFPELASLEHNVYNELLRAFYAVAELRTGRAPADTLRMHSLFQLETHSWLLDYYQVHMLLAELHFAADAATAAKLQVQIQEFAYQYRMPFFARVAGRIMGN